MHWRKNQRPCPVSRSNRNILWSEYLMFWILFLYVLTEQAYSLKSGEYISLSGWVCWQNWVSLMASWTQLHKGTIEPNCKRLWSVHMGMQWQIWPWKLSFSSLRHFVYVAFALHPPLLYKSCNLMCVQIFKKKKKRASILLKTILCQFESNIFLAHWTT